jgi:hypothetical protein
MKKNKVPVLCLFPLLLLAVAASAGAAGDDAWRQELLKERGQKDVQGLADLAHGRPRAPDGGCRRKDVHPGARR